MLSATHFQMHYFVIYVAHPRFPEIMDPHASKAAADLKHSIVYIMKGAMSCFLYIFSIYTKQSQRAINCLFSKTMPLCP